MKSAKGTNIRENSKEDYLMKKLLTFLIISTYCIAISLTSSVYAEEPTFVSITNASSDDQILENGDGVALDINISQVRDSDTTVTLDFNDSIASPSLDFKLRYKTNYSDISIALDNTADVIIPAGKAKITVFLYSILDCEDENNESIAIKIATVSNNLEISEDILSPIIIEDNNYDANYYYVAMNGDDSNDGTCLNPVKTLETALYRFRNNDKTTLIIRDGTYNEINNKHVLKNGSEETPIIIRAEYPGNVFLVGNRSELERDGSDDKGLVIQEASHVSIQNIHFKNFGTGIEINNASNIDIDNCTFENNGHSGLSIVNSSNIKVTNSAFIGLIPNENSVDSNGLLCNDLCAIQDYGVAIWGSDQVSVSDSYFYGRHHQALSFKEGDTNGLAERNVFVGALYTAIFLGQNYENNAPRSTNLIARYNIVLDEDNFPVKSPIRVDNVENATVEYNYFEGFDYSNNLSAIFILKRVEGLINVNHNILSYGVNEGNVGAFEIDNDNGCPNIDTTINISQNTIYKVHHSLTTYNNECAERANMSNNIVYKLLDDPDGLSNDNPGFVEDPIKLNLSFDTRPVDFDSLYEQLTQPFIID